MNNAREARIALTGGMTGSAFLQFTRKLAVAEHNGAELSRTQRQQVAEAVEIFGPEYFYMDGELFG